MSDALPTGDVTFLFTDMAGSTQMVQALGDETFGAVLDEHDRLLADVWLRHSGVCFGSEGDACFVAFADPARALDAAAAAQRTINEHPWPGAAEVRVRIGLHSGRGRVRAGNYWGVDVHYVARVCTAANGGQVLVSQATRDRLLGAPLLDLGEHDLKDFPGAQRLFGLELHGSPTALAPPRAPRASSTTLPDLPPLIGRGAEEPELAALLSNADQSQLVTITGSGGTGKTRLAIAVGRAIEPTFAGGVFFVPLASHAEPEAALGAIARVVGSGDDNESALAERLAERPALLILDNLEQVLDIAPTIGRLLDAVPRLRVLATSQLPLRLAAERLYPLGPLSSSGAIELLVTRARAVAPSFVMTDANKPDVAQLCERLGRLPLALELAAPRLRVLSPAELAERIKTTIDALGDGPADAPERQRSLRAAFGWTMSVLPPATREVFLALGSFSTSWTVGDAEHLCGHDALDHLAVLVDAAIIRRVAADQFDMPEGLRAYARELLERTPENSAVRRRHAELFIRRGLELHDRYYFDVLGTTRDAARAHTELLAAIEWARGADPALHARVVAATVTPNLAVRAGGGLSPDLRLASQRADVVDTAARTLIECGLALEAQQDGDGIQAVAHADVADALAMQAGESPRWTFHARMFAVWMRILADEYHSASEKLGEILAEGASEPFEKIVADFERHFDDGMRRYVRTTRANLLYAQGRLDEAEPLLAELATSSAPPDLPSLIGRHTWALAALAQGAYAEAAERCRDTLLRVGDEPYMPTNHAMLLGTFGAALIADDPELGLMLMACARVRLDQREHGLPLPMHAGHAQQQRRAIEALGDERAEAARRRGAALPFREGCAIAVATGLAPLARS